MGVNGFRDLKVWRESKALAVRVYKDTESGSLSRDFGLRDQMRRAAVSICSNIAEGDERGTDKDSIRLFFIAKAQSVVDDLESNCSQIGRMLGALIKARSKQ